MPKRNSYSKETGNRTGQPLPAGKTEETKGGHKGPSGTSTTGKVTNVPVDMTHWRREVMVSRLKFDDIQKKIYCDELANFGLKGQAGRAAGVSMNTVHRHREDDPDFAEAEQVAIDQYAQKIINHHQNLCLEGELHQTFDKDGKVIGEKRVYPIQLIAMELKRVEPAYREKQVLELNPGQGGGVLVAPAQMTVEEWLERCEIENEKKRLAMLDDLEPVNEIIEGEIIHDDNSK